MVASKPWDWKIGASPYWEEPSAEVYPLINRWRKRGFSRFLDLGCGIGRHAFLFAKNGFSVDALDLSEEGLLKIEEIAESEKLPIKTKLGDMRSLPYPDDSFECLIAYNVIYHADEQGIKQTLNEIRRVLIHGGEALMTLNSQSNSAFTDPQNKHVSEHVLFKTNKPQENGIPHYYVQKKDIPELFSDFKIVQFYHKEEYWDAEYNNAHYYVLASNLKKRDGGLAQEK
jgi:ubiquinone/menaquinone biosynthesis C-methylase UbiE